MPSRGGSPSTERSAPLGSARSVPPGIRSARRAPKTMPSSSELEARRLAPCTPVQATSPTAHRPGNAVAPHRSVTTPPERWWAAGAMGSQSFCGSRPMDASDAAMVGKRWEKRSSPVASSQRWSTPWATMRAAMARLTTSRGASSSTKRSPSRSRRRAPWPRSASERSGRGMAGWCNAVGWNCTNSTSAVATPPRSAMATPSPVDSAGLVVTENSWPAPPVASTTCAARTSTGPSPAPAGGSAVTPTQRPPSTRRSSANQPSSTALAERKVASTSARSTSAPVAAPPACTTRGREWPPSREREGAGRFAVEFDTERDELMDPARSLVDQDPHRLLVAQPGAGRAACRPGAGRSSPRRRRAPRRRHPGPSGWPTVTARPW